MGTDQDVYKDVYPDALQDPKNGTHPTLAHYYIGETKGVLGGSIFWILPGVCVRIIRNPKTQRALIGADTRLPSNGTSNATSVMTPFPANIAFSCGAVEILKFEVY